MSEARILITGASSGIGAALAEHYARHLGEKVHLGLMARRADRLDEMALRLKETGARVTPYTVDVLDAAATREAGLSFAASAGGVIFIWSARSTRRRYISFGTLVVTRRCPLRNPRESNEVPATRV